MLVLKNVGRTIFLFALLSETAHAQLTSYSNEDIDLVYSSVSNVTWTKDANLMATMMIEQGFDNLVEAVISASPIVINTPNELSPDGIYHVTKNDFGNYLYQEDSYGYSSWFGAMAFVNYLNHINYAGSSQWRLPTVVSYSYVGCDVMGVSPECSYENFVNDKVAGNEYAELYYLEMKADGAHTVGANYQENYGFPDTDLFINRQNFFYWTQSETGFGDGSLQAAWYTSMADGVVFSIPKNPFFLYSWAISDGVIGSNITVVPEPENLAMLMAGLGVIGFFQRRRKLIK